jgi:aconitate decarboxylase
MNVHAQVERHPTRKIAQFVSTLTYDLIPSEVRERIGLLILDSLGCGFYGASLPWSKILQDTLTDVDATRSVPVWGTRKALSGPNAALVNGTQIQGFELDDVHRVGVLHVGAVTLPGLFAIISEPLGLSGRDVLTAAVAGYEIGPRVGICMGNEHIGQGWHSGATVGVFSAAAAAARALALDTERTVHALGIAGTQSAGLMAAQYGSMVKRMHAGRSAQSGLYAALLARRGFTGIVDVFEAPYGGFCSTFSRSSDRFNLNELESGLGERFETMRVSLKFYSCVGSNHTTLDAIRAIQNRRPFGVEDVDRIIVRGSQVTVDHVGWPYRPEGLTSAQLNLPFCVATLLIEGDVFVDQFNEACVADPGRIKLAERVEVREDPEITALGPKFRHKVHVEIAFRDGSREQETCEAPRGSEQSFASEADIVAKFRKLSASFISEKQQDTLIDAILHLDRLKDARLLSDLMTGSVA